MPYKNWRDRYNKANISYNYCSICGYTPRGAYAETNRAPLRFWDPDDGWKIGTLCRHCAEDVLDDQPSPDDYAYSKYYEVGEVETDEDPLEAL